jgi:hypothetical protein
MRRSHRVVAVLLLVGCLCGAFVAYGSLNPRPDRNIYPDGPAVAADYETYVDDRVLVSGPVVATDPPTVRLHSGAGDTVTVAVATRHRPAVGDGLTVFGRLRADGHLDARRAFVVPDGRLWYTYTISALAGLWVLVRLLRWWRVDASLAVSPRVRPLGVRTLAAAVRARLAERNDEGSRR